MLGSRTCGDLLGFAGLQDRIEPKVLQLAGQDVVFIHNSHFAHKLPI